MAIGPDADRQVSGRVAVIAAALIGTGTMAVILGVGPIIEGADPLTAAFGGVAMVAGGVMVIGGVGALRRGDAGRALGVAGTAAGMVLSLTLAVAALASLAGERAAPRGGSSPEPVVIGIACIGLFGCVLAFGSLRVIQRVPDRYWHRGGR